MRSILHSKQASKYKNSIKWAMLAQIFEYDI